MAPSVYCPLRFIDSMPVNTTSDCTSNKIIPAANSSFRFKLQ
ncbi:hypothetical protein [Aliamphritea spongicola]|nr:hypothetical protein [Aliamphritea spongicola]